MLHLLRKDQECPPKVLSVIKAAVRIAEKMEMPVRDLSNNQTPSYMLCKHHSPQHRRQNAQSYACLI